MTVALHRVQDLGAASAAFYARESLKHDVSTYLEWRDLQNDAVEDGDTQLAASIGCNMREVRERHDPKQWAREFARQDT